MTSFIPFLAISDRCCPFIHWPNSPDSTLLCFTVPKSLFLDSRADSNALLSRLFRPLVSTVTGLISLTVSQMSVITIDCFILPHFSIVHQYFHLACQLYLLWSTVRFLLLYCLRLTRTSFYHIYKAFSSAKALSSSLPHPQPSLLHSCSNY